LIDIFSKKVQGQVSLKANGVRAQVNRSGTQRRSAGLNSRDAFEQVCASLHATLHFYKPSLSLLVLKPRQERGAMRREEKVLPVFQALFVLLYILFYLKKPR
jgi:hypothetical protein